MPEAARYFLRLRSAISSHLSHAIVPQHTKPQVVVHFASAMDIDDILASVDRSDVSSPESTALDHQLLTRFWVAERTAPELLPWPARLMDRMMERVRQQIETIEDLAAASSDPVASASNATATATLTLSILQTDLSRTQYLLRSLLRQRLSKLTKHSMYYLLLSSSSPAPVPPPASGSTEAKLQQPEDSVPVPDPESLPSKSPLSPSEANFIYTHQTLLARHFGSSFLSSFPPQLRRLDDNAGGTSMVQGPDAREALFVRCLAEEVLIVAPPGDGVDEEVSAATMRMGDVWVVRWEGIKKAWERGDVEVL